MKLAQNQGVAIDSQIDADTGSIQLPPGSMCDRSSENVSGETLEEMHSLNGNHTCNKVLSVSDEYCKVQQQTFVENLADDNSKVIVTAHDKLENLTDDDLKVTVTAHDKLEINAEPAEFNFEDTKVIDLTLISLKRYNTLPIIHNNEIEEISSTNNADTYKTTLHNKFILARSSPEVLRSTNFSHSMCPLLSFSSSERDIKTRDVLVSISQKGVAFDNNVEEVVVVNNDSPNDTSFSSSSSVSTYSTSSNEGAKSRNSNLKPRKPSVCSQIDNYKICTVPSSAVCDILKEVVVINDNELMISSSVTEPGEGSYLIQNVEQSVICSERKKSPDPNQDENYPSI